MAKPTSFGQVVTAKLSTIHQLASFRADGLGQRGIARGVQVQDPAFWDQYDNDTLIYDAIWCAQTRKITIVFPKLINFKPALQAAKWLVNGQEVMPSRLRQFRVYDKLILPCPEPATSLLLRTKQTGHPLETSQADHPRFAGRRVLYTQVKDDPLAWVVDWVRAHHRMHGTDAVLITNNGSKNYTSEDLREAIASVEGIEVADVLEAPLPYGPHPKLAANVGLAKLLQRSLLNIVKYRWFRDAHGVLLCDVDELVYAVGGETIYDATHRSMFKHLRFAGAWRHCAPDSPQKNHRNHLWSRPAQAPCASKYCIVPNSLLGRMSWSVHSLEAVNRRLLPGSKRFGFYHCRAISTSWKSARGTASTTGLERDAATVAFMDQAFPDQTES